MELGNPRPFWGLLAAPLLWWWARANLRRSNPWRTHLASILRGAILLLLLAALARPAVMVVERRTDWLFLIDRSDSMPEAAAGRAAAWVDEARRSMASEDRIAVMSFAAQPSLDLAFGEAAPRAESGRPPDRSETNLEQAIEAALAEFGDRRQKRIVLVSDGNETTGRAVNTVAALVGGGVVLNAIAPPTERETGEVMLENIVMPARVKRGDRYRADIVVSSTLPTAAMIQLSIDGVPVERFKVELIPGENSYPVSLVAESEGMHLLRAEIAGSADRWLENNSFGRFIDVERDSRVLLVTDAAAYSRPLAEALGLQGIQVTLIPLVSKFSSPRTVVLGRKGQRRFWSI